MAERERLSDGRQTEELETFLWQHTNMSDLDLISEVAKCLAEAGYRKQNEGHWCLIEYEYFVCSECGYYSYNGSESTAETRRRLAEGEYPTFCENCGAQMKGGEQE